MLELTSLAGRTLPVWALYAFRRKFWFLFVCFCKVFCLPLVAGLLFVGTGTHSVDPALSQFPCLSFSVTDHRHLCHSCLLPCLVLGSHCSFLHDLQAWSVLLRSTSVRISIPEHTVSVHAQQGCEHACLWDHKRHVFCVCSEGPLRSGYSACCSVNQIRK